VQFGKPIGSFQAIQHKLADMALAVERASSAVYYAAMCIDADDPDRWRAAHVAKAAAGAAATRAAKDGIQIHGGIGYTWDHDLHLYIRRAYTSEHLLGTAGWHHDRLADLLLGPLSHT
jgi:alkylation response protein AidB-like acyl-CoA dehydrogenase